MKITLTFKTPDVGFEATEDIEDFDEREKAKTAVAKWVEYDEYLYVEIDTETGTCTPQKETR